MTMNTHFWGEDKTTVQKRQLEVIDRFKSSKEFETAVVFGKRVCLELVTGVVNHMAAGSQRCPELQSITVLNQPNQKRRQLRCFSGEITVVGDYSKSEAESDVELAYWTADPTVSCHICRVVIFLKPILHTMATRIEDPDALMIPYLMATASIRQVNDSYNMLLANAALPTCRWMRQVKEIWSNECELRITSSSASKGYRAAASMGAHKPGTSDRHYNGIAIETVMQVR